MITTKDGPNHCRRTSNIGENGATQMNFLAQTLISLAQQELYIYSELDESCVDDMIAHINVSSWLELVDGFESYANCQHYSR